MSLKRSTSPRDWGGSPGIDAFGRTRVSSLTTLFDSSFQYDSGPLFWQSVLAGAGAATFSSNQGAVQMITTTASGDKIVRQTYQYFRYQPGKSQQILLTFQLGATKANVRKRVGYFDAQNGIFLEDDGTGLFFVRRSFVSGVAVDTRIPQAQWNVDVLDGTGPSHITLSIAAVQILIIDLQWLGTGRVRLGFCIDGIILYAHDFRWANVAGSTTPYMTTANLPLRYELENTGAAGSGTTMLHICSTVMSEGGYEIARGLNFKASNAVTGTLVSSRQPVLSIRAKGTFSSLVNRGVITFTDLDTQAGQNSFLWELVYNGTLLGTSFSSVNASSIVEFDTAGTSISGGLTLDGGFVGGGGIRQSNGRVSATQLPVTLDINGSNPQPLTFVATALTGTSIVNVALGWTEIY